MEPFEVFLDSMKSMTLPEQMFQATKATWRITELMQGVKPAPVPPKAADPPIPPYGSALNMAVQGSGDQPPRPAAPGTHWERNSMGWIQVYTDPRIYNPDGTLKANPQPQGLPQGESFQEPTWAKELRHDGYWDSVADIWNPLVGNGPKAAWQGAADANIMGKVCTAAIQQYPEDRAEIQLSYSYTEDHNRRQK